MEKKVGKLIVYILLMVSNFIIASESSIVLSMQDMNHKPITQAMCKAPFVLQVELKNLDGYTDIHLMQYITGIENFKSSQSMTSHNVSIDNGKKTVKTFYNFILRSDKKGKFTVGPVTLKNSSGKWIKSNRLIVPVGDEVVSSDKNVKDSYFMTMALDKKQAYIGEKITLTVKFFDRLFVDDLHLQFPEFKNIYFVKNKNKISKSLVTIEDEEYSVTEWVFDMYATESGQFMIQDIKSAFFAPELESKFKFGGAFDFFRSLHKSQKYIIAKPIQVDILPLPQQQGLEPIATVGQFSKFALTLNQKTAPVGQGVVLTVELLGDANFEMMESPNLLLPEGFKYYDSNMEIIDEHRKFKRYEFIVQATNPGTYEIESQSFIYFDPVVAQYKTIQSNLLSDIVIIPSLESSQSFQEADHVDNQFIQNGEIEPKELKDFTIVQQGAVHAIKSSMIPLKAFQYLLFLLFGILLLLVAYRNALKDYIANHAGLNKFIIFLKAKKEYKEALQQQEIYKLYSIFMNIFNQILNNNYEESRDAAIVQYLAEKDFSDEQIQSWKNFYGKILQASFSVKVQNQQQVLFDEALAWIQLLKDKS